MAVCVGVGRLGQESRGSSFKPGGRGCSGTDSGGSCSSDRFDPRPTATASSTSTSCCTGPCAASACPAGSSADCGTSGSSCSSGSGSSGSSSDCSGDSNSSGCGCCSCSGGAFAKGSGTSGNQSSADLCLKECSTASCAGDFTFCVDSAAQSHAKHWCLNINTSCTCTGAIEGSQHSCSASCAQWTSKPATGPCRTTSTRY